MPKDTNYPCSYCEFTSKYKSSISSHIKAVHEHRKNFKCSMCDYAAYRRFNLSQHTKAVHEKIKDIACEQCDFKCSQKEKLTRHVNAVHKGIREYECNLCGLRFSRNDELKKHVARIHEKDMSLPGNNHKKVHVHEGISVWECKKCVHGAKRQVKGGSDLVSGEPWTCAICGLQSAKLSELADHVDERCESENF